MDLRSGLAALRLDAALEAPLSAYLDELEKWNSAYNLTAVRDRRQMVVRHLLDSLVLTPHLRTPLLDVGSGAGLPAIPLAIAHPSLVVTALDSNGKKARFMRHVKRVLGLDNLTVAECRAESFHGEGTFDAIVSRAFASLGHFARVTEPLLAPGGRWLAMKGKLEDEELDSLPGGVRLDQVVPLAVPGLDEARHLIVLARS